jgi:hypothetical protein
LDSSERTGAVKLRAPAARTKIGKAFATDAAQECITVF